MNWHLNRDHKIVTVIRRYVHGNTVIKVVANEAGNYGIISSSRRGIAWGYTREAAIKMFHQLISSGYR